MRTIILIGNGFDIAHGLKTRYSDFLEAVPEPNFLAHRSPYDGNQLYNAINDSNNILWGDIEGTYFSMLTDTTNVSRLNAELEIIKRNLVSYLRLATEEVEPVSGFYNIFASFKSRPIAITFNYTDTAELYREYFEEIIYLHGSISGLYTNPPIFGYAPDRDNVAKLLSKGDEYLKYIKQFEYLGSENISRTLNFFNKKTVNNIFLCGLSCSISDKQILETIFKDPSVKNIYNFYNSNRASHLKRLVRVSRIVGEEIALKKYKSMPECLPMPQKDTMYSPKVIEKFFERYPY